MDSNDEAVDLDHFTIKATVRHNHIARCAVAIEINDANDCEVRANECRACGIGISLWRWCKLPALNEGNRIVGNSFIGMTGNGFQIGAGTANNVFEDNEIVDSGRNGISLTNTGNITGATSASLVINNATASSPMN